MNGNYFRKSYDCQNPNAFGPMDNLMSFNPDKFNKENIMNYDNNQTRHHTSKGFNPNSKYADAYLKQRREFMKNAEAKKVDNNRYQKSHQERSNSFSPKVRNPSSRQVSRSGLQKNIVVQSAEGQNLRMQMQDPNAHQSISNTQFKGTPGNSTIRNNSLENSKNLTDLDRKMKIIIQENDRLQAENENLKVEIVSLRNKANITNNSQNQNQNQTQNQSENPSTSPIDLQKQIQFLKKENDFLKRYSMQNEVELSKNKDFLTQKIEEIGLKDNKIEALKSDVNSLNTKVIDLSQTLGIVKNEVFKNKNPYMERNWSGVYEGKLINTNKPQADRINRIKH